MNPDTFRQASPAWLHAWVLSFGDDANPAGLLALVDLPQLDAGTAREMFWLAFNGAEHVARYDLDRAAAARSHAWNAPWYEIFDRLGRRAATTGFATASYRIAAPHTHRIGRELLSPSERREKAIRGIAEAFAKGRVDWTVADSLMVNSGDEFDWNTLSPEDRATLPPRRSY